MDTLFALFALALAVPFMMRGWVHCSCGASLTRF